MKQIYCTAVCQRDTVPFKGYLKNSCREGRGWVGLFTLVVKDAAGWGFFQQREVSVLFFYETPCSVWCKSNLVCFLKYLIPHKSIIHLLPLFRLHTDICKLCRAVKSTYSNQVEKHGWHLVRRIIMIQTGIVLPYVRCFVTELCDGPTCKLVLFGRNVTLWDALDW